MTDILTEEHARGPFRLLMHCYTSGPELAKTAAELGAYFSVSGIATFKAAEDVRERVRDMPAERIIVEHLIGGEPVVEYLFATDDLGR